MGTVDAGQILLLVRVSKKPAVPHVGYHKCVWHDSLVLWHDSFACVIWIIHTCAMAQLHVWHDPLLCAQWLILMCDMMHSLLLHGSFICAPWSIPCMGVHSYKIHSVHVCKERVPNRAHQEAHMRAERDAHGQALNKIQVNLLDDYTLLTSDRCVVHSQKCHKENATTYGLQNWQRSRGFLFKQNRGVSGRCVCVCVCK